MDQSTRFWDKIAERYSKRPIADEAAYDRKLQVTREYLRPDMEVLEFGCGTGSTAILHAPLVKHIQAIDVSGNMLDIARRKVAAAQISNIDFVQSDIDEYAATDESFDVVLGLSILHLLEDKKATIEKVHQLLKPGGTFVSSTACIGDMSTFVKSILPIGRFFGLMPLVKAFTDKELESALVDAGFHIEHKWQPGKNKGVFIVAKKPA